jgi:hypothetical protein
VSRADVPGAAVADDGGPRWVVSGSPAARLHPPEPPTDALGQLFTQGPAIGGTPEVFDAFGWALAGSGPQSAIASPATPASPSRTQRTAPHR